MALPPNSTANASFLHQLRNLLVQDWDMDDDGRAETLRLPSRRRGGWLRDGAPVAVKRTRPPWPRLRLRPFRTGLRPRHGRGRLPSVTGTVPVPAGACACPTASGSPPPGPRPARADRRPRDARPLRPDRSGAWSRRPSAGRGLDRGGILEPLRCEPGRPRPWRGSTIEGGGSSPCGPIDGMPSWPSDSRPFFGPSCSRNGKSRGR